MAAPIYVGGKSFTALSGSYLLTDLAGGLAAAPQAGDIVIVVVTAFRQINSADYPTVSDGSNPYNTIAQIFSDDSNETHMTTAYKIMGSSPDTAVVIGNSPAMSFASIHVWRGVDDGTPMDVVRTTAQGTDSSVVDCPAITPVTADAVVLAIGANGFGNIDHNINGEPSGYSNFTYGGNFYTRSSTGIASKAWSGSGAENPGAFGVAGTSTLNSWGAVTVALRPRTLALVLTKEYAGITPTSASLVGEVLYDSGTTITRRGFVISDSPISDLGNVDPDTLGILVYGESGSFGIGAFELLVDDLVPNTTYYYRAFAENVGGFDYGDEFTADTLEQKTPIIEAVTPSTTGLNEEVPITITGKNFYVGATVEIDGETCEDILLVDINTITCTAPSSSIQKSAVLLIENANGKRDTASFSYMDEIPPTPQPDEVTATFSVKGVSYLN